VNPCATITALAERSCDIITRERDWSVEERPNGLLDFNAKPYTPLPPSKDLQTRHEQIILSKKSNGLSFDEILEGFIVMNNGSCGFEIASALAETVSNPVKLSTKVYLHRLDNGSYKGVATGIVLCGVLSQDPLLIIKGSVNLFTLDPDVSDAVNLIYDLNLLSVTGETYNFYGKKIIDSSIAFSVSKTWMATTTLYTTISRMDGTVF